MTNQRHLSPVPSEEIWSPNADKRYEQGEINPDQARIQSGIPIAEQGHADPEALPGHVHSIGREITGHEAGLELVTAGHEPQPGARRESTYTPPPARTAREKAARDIGEAHKQQGIVPFGHDPYVRRIK
jgi:hypothetical protein